MKRIILLLTVALILSLGVAGQAWADPEINEDNCAGVLASTANPQTTNKGQWADVVQGKSPQQRDELAQLTANDGNCGDNSVPTSG